MATPAKKYNFDCKPSYGEVCGKPMYRVEYCEDITDGATCVYGPDGHGTPYSDMKKGKDGQPGLYTGGFYMCNWDDKNNKCYLDRPNCPCKCYVGPFDVDESDTAGLGECSKITSSSACPYFYKTDDDKKYGCEWHRGECTQGRIPCTDNTRTATKYASNTCTLGWGTSDSCTAICQDKYGKEHIQSGNMLWEKACKFTGHSRFCECVQK